jgi:hypothetical protein
MEGRDMQIQKAFRTANQQIDLNIVIAEDFNIPLSTIYRSFRRKKINKETSG